MAVKIQVEVFWGVTPCSIVVGYQRFRGSWKHQDPPKRRHPTTALHGVTSQKTSAKRCRAVSEESSDICVSDVNFQIFVGYLVHNWPCKYVGRCCGDVRKESDNCLSSS